MRVHNMQIIWHKSEEHIEIYSPKENHIPRGQHPLSNVLDDNEKLLRYSFLIELHSIITVILLVKSPLIA